MISRNRRSLRPLLLCLPLMLTSFALTACSNEPPALAIVKADSLPPPTRPAPAAPAPVKLHPVEWKVVLDPKSHEPLFALTVSGLYDLEGNLTMLGGWMADAKSVIDFYKSDAEAANAAAAPAAK